MLKYEEATLYQNWYYKDLVRHRVGGPAYISKERGVNCHESHFVGGVKHNLNAPAYSRVSVSGGKICDSYMVAGLYHRVDGPAYAEGDYYEWWINGVEYTEEDFNRIMKVKNAKAQEN